MGKKNRQITIDDDLSEELDQINASGLINELLKDYFNKGNDENLKKLNQKLAEIEEEKRKINKKRREIKQKIEKIKQREARVLKLYSKVPQIVLQELKEFPNMTLMSLRNRYDGIYRRKYSFSWMELKKVFEEMRR